MLASRQSHGNPASTKQPCVVDVRKLCNVQLGLGNTQTYCLFHNVKGPVFRFQDDRLRNLRSFSLP